jgi:hypothetical protein
MIPKDPTVTTRNTRFRISGSNGPSSVVVGLVVSVVVVVVVSVVLVVVVVVPVVVVVVVVVVVACISIDSTLLQIL